ncbi:MAG: hypothetical protein V3T39_04355 [Gammaproteobacteria bacterium]
MKSSLFISTIFGALGLTVISPITTATAAAEESAACKLSETELVERLQLPYDQYEDYNDESETSWRSLEKKRCFAEAARYIHLYVEGNRNNLDPGAIKLQTFHEAMMLSWSGQDVAARHVFGGIHFVEGSEKATGQFNFDDWNAYVDATIAFLDKDRAAFDVKFAFISDRIAADKAGQIVGEPGHPGLRKLFSGVLNVLGNCFVGSYWEAYGQRVFGGPACLSN